MKNDLDSLVGTSTPDESSFDFVPPTEYRQFMDTRADRMDLLTARAHATDGNSPFYEKARERVKQLEADPKYVEAERINSLSTDELLAEFNSRRKPIEDARREQQATRNARIFVRDNSSWYKSTPENATNIQSYLRENDLKPTAMNIQHAAIELANKGLIATHEAPLPAPIGTVEEVWGEQDFVSYGEGDNWL